MSEQNPKTVLCVACYFKGAEFMQEAKKLGCRVLLLTGLELKDRNWPHESIDEFFYVPGEGESWDMDMVYKGLNAVYAKHTIDFIVALDDFDVEKAASLREHFRMKGMGETRARLFRDKLAMRQKAKDAGIPVPAFISLFNDAQINEFADTVSAPWLIKPRMQASATGIVKVHSKEELWNVIHHKLGDERCYYLLEKFAPGAVYHVDALTYEGEVIFARSNKYMDTPMEVAHGGGIFRTHTVEFASDDNKKLLQLHQQLIKSFGLQYSASHTEFIKDHQTGEFYFLETASRVGGAHTADLVEASSGINLWREWAKIELAVVTGQPYELPEVEYDYAGTMLSLAKQEHPDTSAYNDPEIWMHLDQMKHHVGFILKSDQQARIIELMESYATRFFQDFHAQMPIQEKPSH